MRIHFGWGERVIPMIYTKGDCILGCKVKFYGYEATNNTKYFGEIYNYKYFSKSRIRLFNVVDKLLIGLLVRGNMLFVVQLKPVSLLFLFGIFYFIATFNILLLIVLVAFVIMLINWAKICDKAYKNFVINKPSEKGWKLLPLTNNMQLDQVTKIIPNKVEFQDWLNSK